MENIPSAESASAGKGSDGRRDVRFSCDHTKVQAHLDGRAEPVPARVVEVSRSGVQLSVNEALAVGTAIRVSIGGLVVRGHIRYCRQQQDETTWTAGVLIDDVI